MKNIKTFMAIVVLALLLTSCGESSDNTETKTQTGETETPATTVEEEDKSDSKIEEENKIPTTIIEENDKSDPKIEEEKETPATTVEEDDKSDPKIEEEKETPATTVEEDDESDSKIEEENKIPTTIIEEEKTNSDNLDINNTETMKKTEVKKWDQVAVSYTGTLDDWEIFDATSRHGWEPLKFVAWAKQMIAWFDAGVIGMKVWEKKTIKIEPKDAYGEYDKSKKQIIGLTEKDKKAFEEAWVKLEKWSEFPTMNWPLPIAEVTDNSITVDMNHPLAWKKLIFEVEMLEIK